MGLQALVAVGRPPACGRVGLPYGQQCRTRMEYGWYGVPKHATEPLGTRKPSGASNQDLTGYIKALLFSEQQHPWTDEYSYSALLCSNMLHHCSLGIETRVDGVKNAWVDPDDGLMASRLRAI